MNIYFYLFLASTALLIGTITFGRFEINTPLPRRLFKVVFLLGGTMLFYLTVGEVAALVFPMGMLIVGTIFHFAWCKKNSIHPLTAEPRDRYYQLRGWS